MRARHLLISSLALLPLLGCAAEEPPAPAPDAGLVQAALAKADAVDGTEDRVVSACLTCNLGMSGDEAHASELEGYTFHLCSEHCLKRFEEDKTKALLAARLPK